MLRLDIKVSGCVFKLEGAMSTYLVWTEQYLNDGVTKVECLMDHEKNNCPVRGVVIYRNNQSNIRDVLQGFVVGL